MQQNDTIAAIATAPGTGAIAVIRVSGESAREVVQVCTGGKMLQPRLATLVRVRDACGRVVDECVATYFAGPASYTGEDTVELSCHGGMLVTRRVLERVLECGARPAEAGEFTRRAFENGKMELTQAAAVDVLINVAAHVEAYIDFPEEDIAPDTTDALLTQLEEVETVLRHLLSTADEGRLLREGIRTAIVGAPNVGKSSLLNMLLGYERAIVSSVAGTTRDTIEESVALGGMRLRLIDTAGLHESEDAIECAGMERSRRAGAEADLLLEVADATAPRLRLELPQTGAHHLLVLNKCDQLEHADWAGETSAIRISCHRGTGLAELEQAVERIFLNDAGERDSLAAINARHRHALVQALEYMEAARAALLAGESPEFVDVELRAALDSLGSITGRIDTEDILTRVFATFCLGK